MHRVRRFGTSAVALRAVAAAGGARAAPLPLSTLTAVTGIDGRYAGQTAELREYFSEYALIKQRVVVEVEWLRALANHHDVKEVPRLSADAEAVLHHIVDRFDVAAATRVKEIEKTTNHDVKAVEYYLKERFAASGNSELTVAAEFLHFACTSEDISNLAYARTFHLARADLLLPIMNRVVDRIADTAEALADAPMLCRTHGQPATPSTMGKEWANFAYRLHRQVQSLASVAIQGKFGGAVGCYNAHSVAYPTSTPRGALQGDSVGMWERVGWDFVTRQLQLNYNPYCTQIEPHDWIAEFFHALSRFNTVLLSFDRDVWGYISLGYFAQRVVEGEVGSSTMPHKVNPIDFENSEGNLGVANALALHYGEKLPVSRFQRDLSDSTVLRTMGTSLGHSVIAYKSTLKGIDKLQANLPAMAADLNAHAEVLGEPIQTVMRRFGADSPYEKLKQLTRGKGALTTEMLSSFVRQQEEEGVIPAHAAAQLQCLTPASYLGLAPALARAVKARIAEGRGQRPS